MKSTIKCPKCGSEMHKSMEPKVATLANEHGKFPDQIQMWRCGKCGHKEKF